MSTSAQPLAPFLTYALGDREVSLAIASDANEVQAMRRLLRKQGYAEFSDPFLLLGDMSVSGKWVLIVEHGLEKPAYDLAAQYPTGQVQLFNPATMASAFVSPAYAGSSLVMLLTESMLASMIDSGLDPRGKCGLTYRR